MDFARVTLVGVTVAVLCAACTASAAPEGDLIAYYPCNELRDGKVVDESGNGFHGEVNGDVKWSKGGFGTALRLNGKDAYVDCGVRDDMDFTEGGTLMLWCRSAGAQGGMINWSTGSRWADQRLVLAISNWTKTQEPWIPGALADGKASHCIVSGFGRVAKGQWMHLAFTFDGKTCAAYRDGVLAYETPQTVKPDIKGVPLWLGRCQGLGDAFFDGLVDEVRIYNKAISYDRVRASYLSDARTRGKDTSVFEQLGIKAYVYPTPGSIITHFDAQMMQPLPDGCRVNARLLAADSDKPIHEESTDIARLHVSEIIFDPSTLSPGRYVVDARVLGPDDKQIGKACSTTVQWVSRPDSFKNIKILNNLCWELVNTSDVAAEHRFVLPCDRWVFIRTTAQLGENEKAWVAINTGPTVIVHDTAGRTTLEAMRYLEAGEHTLRTGTTGSAKLHSLVVRAVPALQYAYYGADPIVKELDRFDREFLSKYVLPNTNVIVGLADTTDLPLSEEWTEQIRQWKAMGRKWITLTRIPPVKEADDAAVDTIYEFWKTRPGYSLELMDGIMVDEFEGGDLPIFDVYCKVLDRLFANPAIKGKTFWAYSSRLLDTERSRRFAGKVLDGGGYVSIERYINEKPTEADERIAIRTSIPDYMAEWHDRFPDSAQRICMVLSNSCLPPCNQNMDPSVDYRVHTDMQFQSMATHPAVFGLGAIQEYHSGYCDPEVLRLIGRLYRHYAIEGNTEPLLTDPYRLTHLVNPDFADGLAGWSIDPAEPDSIRSSNCIGYARLQGRWPPDRGGDDVLMTTRSADKPNTFSQQVKGLVPGRLYSMKMLSGDHHDLMSENSNKHLHAVSITLDNADVPPGATNSVQAAFPHPPGMVRGKFSRGNRYWMNYHWRVFRAKGKAATLTVSDWKSESDPGGPIGQELMFNFIEVQPYIGD